MTTHPCARVPVRERIVVTLVCLLAAAAQGRETLEGHVFSGEALPVDPAAAGAPDRLLFDFEVCGPFFRTSWRDGAGALVAKDELLTERDELRRYWYWRPNVDEWARVTREASGLRIEISEAGRHRSGSVEAGGETVVGPMIALLAQRHLGALSAGERVAVSYAVPDRLAVYRFTMSGSEATDRHGSEVAVTPESWLVRRFVNPVKLYFDPAGHFAGLRGRALPVANVAGQKKPLELTARVHETSRRPCSPAPTQPPVPRAD